MIELIPSATEAKAYFEEFGLAGYRIGQLQENGYVHEDRNFDSRQFNLFGYYKSSVDVREIDFFADNDLRVVTKRIQTDRLLRTDDPDYEGWYTIRGIGGVIINSLVGNWTLSKGTRYAVAEYPAKDGDLVTEVTVFGDQYSTHSETNALHSTIFPTPIELG